MENKDVFSSFHPIVNISFFGLVLWCTMFLEHPLFLGISMFGGSVYQIQLKGKKALSFQWGILFPMCILLVIVNPVFHHEGMTILGYLPTGNPVTLESICYGMGSGIRMVAVILWFSCYHEVMTSDKFIYLFGKIIPASSLVLSMSLRFVPKFRLQMEVVRQAQKCIGRDSSNGSMLERVKQGVTILSILITWSLENAIETADSMKSRGYGLKGRTAFSIYTFDKRDGKIMVWIGGVTLFLWMGWCLDATYFRYYPTLKWAEPTKIYVLCVWIYLALVGTPTAIALWESKQWEKVYGKERRKR